MRLLRSLTLGSGRANDVGLVDAIAQNLWITREYHGYGKHNILCFPGESRFGPNAGIISGRIFKRFFKYLLLKLK
jgi:hypothetical protein